MRSMDTSEEAARLQLEIHRRTTPERRLEIAAELSEMSRELLREGIRRRHPEYSEAQVRLAAIRRVLGPALFRAAYAAEPELDP